MKKLFCIFLACVMLLSGNVFASADSDLESKLAGVEIDLPALERPETDKTMERADFVTTTDNVSLTDSSIVIRTADGLYISYVCPTEYVIPLSQDLMQQASLYLAWYPNNMSGQATEFINQGMHLSIYDYETQTDIYIYAYETPFAQTVQNMTSLSDADVMVVQAVLTESAFSEAKSVVTGFIGNNLWIFADYGTAGEMLTFVNGLTVDCIIYYAEGDGPSTGLALLNTLTIAAA